MEQEMQQEEEKGNEKEKEKLPTLMEMILSYYPNFFKELDYNLKLFAREIKIELREEGHVVIGITGYPGVGKSNDASLIGALIDKKYSFDRSICFIPTAKDIEELYLSLPMFSYLHIDRKSVV